MSDSPPRAAPLRPLARLVTGAMLGFAAFLFAWVAAVLAVGATGVGRVLESLPAPPELVVPDAAGQFVRYTLIFLPAAVVGVTAAVRCPWRVVAVACLGLGLVAAVVARVVPVFRPEAPLLFPFAYLAAGAAGGWLACGRWAED